MGAEMCQFYRRNLWIAATVCLLSYATIASAAALDQANALSVTLLGVPLTSLLMAATGTLIGFLNIKPVGSRKRLYALIAAHTILAAWLTALVPRWQGWDIPAELVPPLAGVFAIVSVIFVPVVIEHGPVVLSAFLAKYTGYTHTPRGGE